MKEVSKAQEGPVPPGMRHPAEILQAILAARSKNNSSYSLRAFARDLSVSPTFMSLILNRKKDLPVVRASQMARALGLSTAQTQEFVRSTVYFSSTLVSREVKPHIQQSLRARAFAAYDHLDLERFEAMSNWYSTAILDLTACESFRSDPQWIARALGLSLAVTKQAIMQLLRLGLLKKENGQLKKTSKSLYIPTQKTAAAVREHHRQMIRKASDALSSPRKSDFDRRSITGTTFAIDPDRVNEAMDLIDEFHEKMTDFLTEGKVRELYQLNIQLFPLTHLVKRKSK